MISYNNFILSTFFAVNGILSNHSSSYGIISIYFYYEQPYVESYGQFKFYNLLLQLPNTQLHHRLRLYKARCQYQIFLVEITLDSLQDNLLCNFLFL